MKNRLALSALAFAFAIVGAFASTVLAPIDAFYKISTTCQEEQELTNESNCDPNRTSGNQCTVDVSGDPLAWKDDDCTAALFRP